MPTSAAGRGIRNSPFTNAAPFARERSLTLFDTLPASKTASVDQRLPVSDLKS